MPDSPRRRGAPLGNQNALKHGYYSKLFPKTALKGLPPTGAHLDVSEEVQVMRLAIHRLLELSQDVQSLPEAIALIKALSVASSGLSRLARLQQMPVPDQASVAALALQEAMADVLADLEAEEPSSFPGN